MSVPSFDTDNSSSSTIIDDDMSVMVHDPSDTTVATQTSTSWHSIVSDIHLNIDVNFRPHTINTWLKVCLIEPDIRLTTAQEWKLRTCMKHLISLCNLPLKISCIRTKEFVSITNEDKIIPLVDLDQNELVYDQLQQLGLYLHILPITDMNNDLLEVKLFEFYFRKSSNTKMIPIQLTKKPKFLFQISSNLLILYLRSSNSLLELRFSTRENEIVRGIYYQWNEIKNEHIRFDTNVEIDQSLIDKFK
ncbi:unnamed protein product [Adineta steineri]|uniref:Uncharacterized protein n=1 Tax=Adineta steineri TaxID=433720 RepID=A0A813NDQ0_9BILA|nr:unnamed protein product [Adineta steineri]